MGKSADSKLRLLYLMRYLLRETDEAHPAGIADMLEELGRYGITANRKTVYDDLEALKLFGLDLVSAKSHSTGYYVASRDFELPELKLLVDSVQSSKFITQKKTLSLIRKIEGLASVHEGQLLQRQVYVHNRVKTMNESVYYNVDELSSAIARDRGIRFRYFEFEIDEHVQVLVHRLRINGTCLVVFLIDVQKLLCTHGLAVDGHKDTRMAILLRF